LIANVSTFDLSKQSDIEKKAFYINAYNLLVINSIVKNYPVNSPMEVTGFFDGIKHQIAGEKRTLDEIENKILRPTYKDPRFHFVLVCGAVGCPPIINEAYFPERLDEQMEQQAKASINSSFVNVDDVNKRVEASEIMSWYKEDFVSKTQTEIDYLNKYRTTKIPADYKLTYSKYNWALNKQTVQKEVENNTSPTVSSGGIAQTYNAGSLLKKGKFDLTLFNSVYTQNKSDWLGTVNSGFRETFYTSLLQFTLGTSKNARINLGVDVNIKSNARSADSTYGSIIAPLDFANNDSSRFGVTSVGFRVKIAPFKGNDNFTLQSTLLLPTIEHPEGFSDPTGQNSLYWADWNRFVWWNQFFYTKDLGTKFQLFTEADLLFRFASNADQISFLDMPTSVFLSYFPAKKITIYGMSQFVPRFPYNSNPANTPDWVISSNYTAVGGGMKYQLSKKIQLEFLYTNFVKATNAGLGESFNIGIKFLN
ncbi:MAG: DUF547 domain-containing protein, partial [Vicingaceae bacterium]